MPPSGTKEYYLRLAECANTETSKIKLELLPCKYHCSYLCVSTFCIMIKKSTVSISKK